MRFSASSLNRLRSNQTTRWSPWAYIIGTCILFYVFVGKSSSQANRPVTHASSTEERKALVVDPKSLVTCPAVGSPYRLACIQSYGFFQTVHEDDWKREQEHARTQQQHDPPSHSEPTTWRERWIPSIYYMDHFQPTFTCPHSRRVGGLLDGGKWVCDLYRLRDLVAARRTANEQRPCLIYSIGSNGQFEFEEALVNVLGKDTCEIHVFDFDNYDKPELHENNIHFHTWGLTSSAQSGLRLGKHELLSFQDTQDRLGHTGRAIDLFKIDCEGCEWDSYKDWIFSGDIRQILIETHGYAPKPMKASDFFNDLYKNNFMMFSKEPNAYLPLRGFIEWSFIRLHPDFLTGKVDTSSPTGPEQS